MASNSHLILAVLSLALGPAMFGYHLAELNAPEAAIRCLNSAPEPVTHGLPSCIPMSASQWGLVGSIFAVGGLIGALLAAPIVDRLGRKKTVLANESLLVAGPLIMATAVDVSMLAFGRFLSGIGTGVLVVVVPLYVNELAPPESKGSFGAITQLAVNLGILLTQSLGLFLSEPYVWRRILFIGGAIGALQFFSVLFCAPDSPRWLFSVGRKEEARKMLQSIRGGGRVDEELEGYRNSDVEAGMNVQLEGMASSELTHGFLDNIVEEERLLDSGGGSSMEKVGVLKFLTKHEYRPALMVVVGVMAAQQLTGINSIIMYGTSILQNLLPTSAVYINVGISLINFLITLAATPFFDRFPTKLFLTSSMAGMGSMAAVVAIGMSAESPITSAIGTLLFVSSFSFGLGPLPWSIASQRVKFEAVGAAQSVALVTNWLGTFTVGLLVPVFIDAFGVVRVFCGFSVVGLGFAVWGWWVL